MAIDKFTDLPGIISEIQDGGLQIFEENSAPSVLVIGTAEKGATEIPVQVTRAQELENRFGKNGTLMRGMYEALSGGAENLFVMRMGAKSAVLEGVGTDDQQQNPTTIETLIKDKDAADAYLVRYTAPADRGANEVEGHLIVKNALGAVVYDNNPGGQVIDAGEVIVSGEFDAGVSIGSLVDTEDFKTMREIASDFIMEEEVFTAEAVATGTYTLTNIPQTGTVMVKLDDVEIATADFTVSGADVTLVESTDADNKEVKISYEYDADGMHNLKDGSDGTNLSRMEMYEAIENAFIAIENEEFKIINIVDTYLDDKNIEDGNAIILTSDERIPEGRRYPVANTKGDALGKFYKEEFEGEMLYFWDTDNDGAANVWPMAGAASATTKCDGSALEASDFQEVNFAYQLANFCFQSSSNEYNVSGTIGVKMPKSFSAKDLAQWVGKEAVVDFDGKLIANGTGLVGNKFLAGKTNYQAGFWGTEDGFMPGASGSDSGKVITDLGGRPVDIGRYISIFAGIQTFFNNIDETGFGYNANGAGYYAGYYATLPVQSAPTNKIADNTEIPFKLSKTKLNSLAKHSMIAYKEKNGVLRFSDAPTAARKDSDFRRLTTIRVVSEVIDVVRDISEPYIGEPNTQNARASLQTNINVELAKLVDLGVIQRFEALVSSTVKQQIEGDATVELIIVPPFELRKIHVITSLAKQ